MSDFATIAFYLCVGTIALLFCRQSERSGSPQGLFLAVLVLTLVSGLRDYSVGIDTFRYKMGIEYFYETGRPYWQVVFSNGYGYFASFFLHIWNNYSFLLFVQALITNGLIAARLWDFRNGASLTFMLFFYICTAYLMTLNIICQWLAVSVVFYSSRFLDKGKILWFIAGVALAICLHNSAVVALLMLLPYIVNFKGASTGRKAAQALACLVFVVATLFGYQYLTTRYSGYLYSSEGISFGFMSLAQALVFVFSFFVAGYFSKKTLPDKPSAARSLLKGSHDLSGRSEEGQPADVATLCQQANLYEAIRACAPHAVFFYVLYILFTLAAYIVDPAGRISYYFLLYGAPCFAVIARRSGVSMSCFFASGLLVLWLLIYAGYSYFLIDGGGVVPYSFIFTG